MSLLVNRLFQSNAEAILLRFSSINPTPIPALPRFLLLMITSYGRDTNRKVCEAEEIRSVSNTSINNMKNIKVGETLSLSFTEWVL